MVGIYWNNHHHVWQTARSVNGAVLLANMHLLFWLSLFPFVTGWMGENHFASVPAALFGVVALMSAVAYTILVRSLIGLHGKESPLAKAIGGDSKGWISLGLYAVAIPAAFFDGVVAFGIYVLVAVIWFIPDTRIERTIAKS